LGRGGRTGLNGDSAIPARVAVNLTRIVVGRDTLCELPRPPRETTSSDEDATVGLGAAVWGKDRWSNAGVFQMPSECYGHVCVAISQVFPAARQAS
jgi:hypothetical protein